MALYDILYSYDSWKTLIQMDNLYMHRAKHDNTHMLARIRVEVLIVAGSDNLLHRDQNQ